MRIVKTKQITDAVVRLVIESALVLRPDVTRALRRAIRTEQKKTAKDILRILLENAGLARTRRIPICQDTGMTVVYCEIGRDVSVHGNLDRAINKGVALATRRGFLRRSVVVDPITRANTGTNTPAVIHYSWRNGSKVKLSVLLKGFGCENKGQTVMLNPTATVIEIKREVLRIIREAGANACPPYVVGVGVGGTLDTAAGLAKQALLEPLGKKQQGKAWQRKLAREILNASRALNIGPLGLGGTTTVLDVHVKTFPTHIAGLPLAVNINCHALRSRTIVL